MAMEHCGAGIRVRNVECEKHRPSQGSIGMTCAKRRYRVPNETEALLQMHDGPGWKKRPGNCWCGVILSTTGTQYVHVDLMHAYSDPCCGSLGAARP